MTQKNRYISNTKTIRINGLKRTGLYMGYYSFQSSENRDFYVHLISNPNLNTVFGSIAKRDGTDISEFHNMEDLKELIKQYRFKYPVIF